MKSVSLNKFVPNYIKLIREALEKNEQIMVTSRGLPYFICKPVVPRVDYKEIGKETG